MSFYEVTAANARFLVLAVSAADAVARCHKENTLEGDITARLAPAAVPAAVKFSG